MRRDSVSKNSILLVMTVALVVVCVSAVIAFIWRVKNHEDKSAYERIESITKNNASVVLGTFYGHISTLNAVAVTLHERDDLKSAAVMDFLAAVAEEEGFLRMAINFPDGISYTSDGNVVDYTSLGGVERIATGKPYIDDVADAIVDGVPVINIHVPIFDKDKAPVAALRAALKVETMGKLLNSTMYAGDGYFFVIDGNGRYVTFDPRNYEDLSRANYFGNIDKYKYAEGFSSEHIQLAFKYNQPVYSQFTYKGEAVHARFEPVGINNWMAVVVIPLNSIRAKADIGIGYARDMLIVVILALVTMFLYIIIAQKKSREKAELDEKCFRLLAKQSGKVIYEWDYTTDKVAVSENFVDYFGRMPILKSGEDEEAVAAMVHPDDLPIYNMIFTNVRAGENINGVRLRLMDGNNTYHWCVLHAALVKRKDGSIYKALGTLENIDEQIRKEEALHIEAQTDSLTRLYNKKAAEYLIGEALSKSSDSQMHAIMCFDIDDFKQINDSFGHLYGDNVLIEIASTMKKMFRSSDILGRFGGDEFIAFIKDIPDVEFIKEKADAFYNSVRKKHSEGDVEKIVSVSLGISIYPRDGKTYAQLYKKADEASYMSKNSGKDRFIVYGNDDAVDVQLESAR